MCAMSPFKEREKKVSNRRSGFSFGYFFLLSYRGIVGSHHTIHDCRFFFFMHFSARCSGVISGTWFLAKLIEEHRLSFFFLFFLCRLLIWNFGVLGVTRYIKCACGIILMLAQPVPGSGRPL